MLNNHRYEPADTSDSESEHSRAEGEVRIEIQRENDDDLLIADSELNPIFENPFWTTG